MSETVSEIEIVHLPVEAVHPNDYNPNQQSDVVAKATRESLTRFGFVEPIAVRAHPDIAGEWIIINGEHRHGAAVELGYTSVPAVVLDVTEDEAKRLTIILNETTGDADVVLLGQLLSELQHLDDFQMGLPYTDTELDHLLSIGAEDWDQYRNNDPAPAPPGDPIEHEVVLTMSLPQHDLFRGWLTILEKEYGGGSVTDLVVEAVRRAALAVNQG